MLRAEIKNFLCFRDVADKRSRNTVAMRGDLHVVDRFERPQVTADGHGGISLQQGEVRVQVMLFRHGAQDEVESPGKRICGVDFFLQLFLHYSRGPDARGLFLLFLGRRKEDNGSAHGDRHLGSNVTETAKANDAHLAAGLHTPVLHGRVGRHSGA